MERDLTDCCVRTHSTQGAKVFGVRRTNLGGTAAYIDMHIVIIDSCYIYYEIVHWVQQQKKRKKEKLGMCKPQLIGAQTNNIISACVSKSNK